ncbi:MAG: protein kinase [Pyrinomonadaceae bacterium]
MNREDYQKVKQIFQSALDAAPGERDDFLDEACREDKDLRFEVERLLDSLDSDYLEQPAIGKMAEFIASEGLRIGQTVGRYEILEKIGAGGMGEVFLAEDPRLKRKIALKILPAMFSQDKERLRRFEQEARAASALNHPNILTVHEFGAEDGSVFIASEFVKGETLRERIAAAPVDLREALSIVLQVAAALNAAHESGIAHRDIKPENIMLRDDGFVKVLDFGLAKLTEKKNEIARSDAETLSQLNTTPGLVMGTAAYMSPEQARGLPTDARSDIWSFGVVLYEMISRRQPFTGGTSSDKIASILKSEPAPLDANTPPELVRIVRKALQKNRDERYQIVKDLLLDLKTFEHQLEFAPFSVSGGEAFKKTAPGNFDAATSYFEAPTGENRTDFNTNPIFTARSRLPNGILIAACALLITLAGAAVLWKFISQNRNQVSTNLLASLRVRPLINWNGEAGEDGAGARFSPNGAMIAYSLTKNGRRNIWTKQIPEGKPNPITDGNWDYYNPVWSPDGQRIAFVTNRDNQTAIWSMPFSGGEMTPIKPIEGVNVDLLKWSKTGATIYYRQRFNLFALDVASRQISRITNFDSAAEAQFFSISPGEDRIAYSAGANERLRIFVMPMAGGEPVQVTNDAEASDEYPFWLPDGKRIIYSSQREGIFQTCIAYLDEGRTEQLNLSISDTLLSDVTPDGSRILFEQGREESDLWQIKPADKSETQITFEPGLELWSDASPDGKSVIFQAATESKHLLEGAIQIRSTDDTQQINIAANGFSPKFSPDGSKAAFLRDADKLINLWITGRNGADERQLTTGGIWFPGFTLMPYNRAQVRDYSWSPDSASLIYCAKKDGLWNVFQIAADGASQPQRISDNTDENVWLSGPVFAPDGKRIAYTSSAVKASADGKKTTNLYLFSGGNSALLFSSESVFKLIGWEESGKNLLIAMPEDKIAAKPTKIKLILVSAAGNNQTDLASIEAAYFNNIQLSPDGRRIAFAAHEDGKDNIRIISSAGGEPGRAIVNVDPSVYISGIAWSPDGKAIYYSKQKTARTISMIENFK